MKTYAILIVLAILLISKTSFAQTADAANTFEGIKISKKKESFLIPVKEKLTVITKTGKFKGILDSVGIGKIYMNGQSIITSDIEKLKFIPQAKRGRRNAFLISAATSFVGAVGFVYWYLGSGGEWTNKLGTALLIYTPVGLLIGTVLSIKKEFKLKKGWEFTTIEKGS